MILRAPTKKPIKLKPVRANAGLEVAYRVQLEKIVDALQKTLLYRVKAAWRANNPHVEALHAASMAQDASPAKTLQGVMGKVASDWRKRMNAGAPELAQWFVEKSRNYSDAALRATLKKAGFSVDFKITKEMNDAYQASIAENINLIKSIASEHLQKVEAEVMRSVQQGRKLSDVTAAIQKIGGMSKRRAAFIARDQNNKATAIMTKVRQLNLGIKKATWMHSGGGIHPRESHEEADGTVYNVAEGCYIDGEYIQPGELPNCRCVSAPIIPGLEDE